MKCNLDLFFRGITFLVKLAVGVNLNKKICIRKNNFNWRYAQNLHSLERQTNACIVLGSSYDKDIKNPNTDFDFSNILQRETSITL